MGPNLLSKWNDTAVIKVFLMQVKYNKESENKNCVLLTLYLMLTVLTYSISHAYSSYLPVLKDIRQILLEFKDTKGIIKISKSRRRHVHVCTIVIPNAIYSINIVYTKKKTCMYYCYN